MKYTKTFRNSDFFGISERTIQRWNKNGTKDLGKGAEKSVPRKLTEEETGKIYEVCCSQKYKDLNPHEIYHDLPDKVTSYRSLVLCICNNRPF